MKKLSVVFAFLAALLFCAGTGFAMPPLPQNSLARLPAYKSTTYTAVNGDMLLCDTSSAGFTVTLPPSPSTGWSIVFEDAAGTWGINALTLGANGNKIMGVVANYPLQISGTRVTVVYSGSANGWRVYQ